MGLYDRDYGRDYGTDQPPGVELRAPQSATTKIVLITGAIYLLQVMFDGEARRFSSLFGMSTDWYSQPWQIYRLLTYGFLHDTQNAAHILLNMFIFWMFGRELEQRYGARNFVAFYLTAIVCGGLAWLAVEAALGSNSVMYGASGGVSAVVALYALNFPHRKVLLMFVIPMPMWVLAIFGIVYDISLAMDRFSSVAATAHLGGTLFGFIFYKTGWTPANWFAGKGGNLKLKRKPKLRIHAPNEEETEFEQRVNEILRKINEQGQDSLTRSERRFMQRASREYKKRNL